MEGIVARWNFIGRSRQGIEQGRKDWMEGTRFGEVRGYGGRLTALQCAGEGVCDQV
ncbi:hypothetical protein ACH40F_10240 [Streptomyces sp. NPDC020794]|uniref:hypothetical protein n=1 Tax=unclassified Streptomyces TaxID=2593676 RepID=UPI0036EACD60